MPILSKATDPPQHILTAISGRRADRESRCGRSSARREDHTSAARAAGGSMGAGRAAIAGRALRARGRQAGGASAAQDHLGFIHLASETRRVKARPFGGDARDIENRAAATTDEMVMAALGELVARASRADFGECEQAASGEVVHDVVDGGSAERRAANTERVHELVGGTVTADAAQQFEHEPARARDAQAGAVQGRRPIVLSLRLSGWHERPVPPAPAWRCCRPAAFLPCP